MGRKIKDLTGRDFGYLRVLSIDSERSKSGRTYWNCHCNACGNEKSIAAGNLTSGASKSCGCKRGRKPKQPGQLKTETSGYNSWANMKTNCNDFGGWNSKGPVIIGYDPKWETFEGFMQDMGTRPEGCFLARKDLYSDFCKENCVWVTRQGLTVMRGQTKEYEWEGRSFTISEWVKVFAGVTYGSLYQRLRRNDWDPYRFFHLLKEREQ